MAVSKSKIFFYACLIFIGAVLIYTYFDCNKPKFTPRHISYYNSSDIEITGVIADEPDVREDHEKIIIKPDDYDGLVLVKKYLYPHFKYGDRLALRCDLKSPEPIQSEEGGRVFYYDKFLAKDGIYSSCYYPNIEYISSGHGHAIKSALLNIKHNFINQEQQIINDPYASFLGGLIWGAKKSIPGDLMEKFNITGTTHIVALSGYNITIIAVLIMNMCRLMWIPRRYSFWISVVVIAFFVFITGAQASIVRAGIMGIMVLISRQTGRLSSMRNLLAFSAVVMLAINPMLLLYDAGFQLSFLATIGLVYLSPWLKKFFMWLPQSFELRENVVATVSATLITLPLIIYQFGRLSVVAVVANMLILPLIPWAMGFGFMAIILSYLWLPLAQAFSGIVWLVLQYIIWVVDSFSKFSFAAYDIPPISWVFLFLSYSLFFLFIIFINKNAKQTV